MYDNVRKVMIAYRVLKKLQEKFPTAVLAGGAVRDDLLGREIKDLDFNIPSDMECKEFKKELVVLGFNPVDTLDERMEDYGNPYIKGVFNDEVEGVKVQYILTKNLPMEEIISDYPVSLSQVVFDGKTTLVSPYFLASRFSSIVLYRIEYKAPSNFKYVRKLRDYFPNKTWVETRQPLAFKEFIDIGDYHVD